MVLYMELRNVIDDPLFNTAGAAKYLMSSAPTLERWRRNGVGPDFCKMGAAIRYRKSALDRFIEASTRSVVKARTKARQIA